MAQFQIRKDSFPTSRVVTTDSQPPGIEAGEILVKVDRFAYTANNITYAVAGDSLGYWQFFPPIGEEAAGWGVTPVWGFADVVATLADGVAVGERLFGYFPPASYLRMTPVKLSITRLFDGAAHRAKLPPGYNAYSRISAEPNYDPSLDAARMLLWPLHLTSFCIWDVLQEQAWFGAERILILSASSKTSIGLGFALHEDAAAPRTIALTSAGNRAFVEQLGVYDETMSYADVDSLDATIPTVIVDMSGNGELLGRLHSRLGDNMRRCINVGVTHWDELKPGPGVIAERSAFFFAPAHIQRRMQEWGAEGFAERTSGFLQRSAAHSQQWLSITELAGLDGLAEVYADVCLGRVAPELGLVVVM